MTDVRSKFVCKCTKFLSCRGNRPVVRSLRVPVTIRSLSAGTSFVCFNSVQGYVHFKNSPDLMESQRTDRPADHPLSGERAHNQ